MNTIDRHDRGGSVAQRQPFGALGRVLRAGLELARLGIAAVVQRQRQNRRLRRQIRALVRLDARTLKDIGIDRSELGSVAAELVGRAEPSRRRTGASAPGRY